MPYLIKCFHRLFPVPSIAALSPARILSKEIDEIDVIMREAGLLVTSLDDERATGIAVDQSANIIGILKSDG